MKKEQLLKEKMKIVNGGWILNQSSSPTHSKEEIKKKISQRLKENKVKRASFFGSITREDFNESSDIDIVIEFEGKKSLLDLVKLKYLLEDELGRKIDLITYNSINPLVKQHILHNREKII